MNPLRGILLKVTSVTIFVAMASLIKASAAQGVPPGEAVFFRSLFAIPVIVVWLTLQGHLHDGLKTTHAMSHVWRGLVGTCAMGLGFAGLGLLPLPEVTAIGYAAPLLVVVLAAMFLGEQVRIYRLSAVALGLVGVLIVLSPRMTVLETTDVRQTLGAVLVLGSAMFAALAQVFVRKLVQIETTAAIVFYFSVSATVLSMLTIPYGWIMPSVSVLAMLVAAGLLGGVGQIFLTSAYRFADVSVIAPFEYASMLLALASGYFIFNEVPTLTMLGGAMLVILAGVLIIWREHQLGLEREKQRRAMTPGG
ncbi:MAG: DMT family transporter [Paracoccaceae bacterium]